MTPFDAIRAARVAFKKASEIDATLKALSDSEKALLGADDDAGRAAARALSEAKARLLEARRVLTASSPLTVVP